MVLQDAFDKAQRFLNEVVRPEHDAEIVINKCSETEDRWVFGFNSRTFFEEGDASASLIGNGPLVVPKSGEAPYIDSVFDRLNAARPRGI